MQVFASCSFAAKMCICEPHQAEVHSFGLLWSLGLVCWEFYSGVSKHSLHVSASPCLKWRKRRQGLQAILQKCKCRQGMPVSRLLMPGKAFSLCETKIPWCATRLPPFSVSLWHCCFPGRIFHYFLCCQDDRQREKMKGYILIRFTFLPAKRYHLPCLVFKF